MNKDTKIVMGDNRFRRFDRIRAGQQLGTVVKVQDYHGAVTLTVRQVKWSRWRVFIWFKRLFIIIKYR